MIASGTKYKEFCRYLVASAIALLLDFSTLFLLTEFLSFHYLVSACLGFSAGLVIIYLLSIRWVFGARNQANPAQEFILFSGIGIAGLALNEAIMFLATDWLGLHYLISKTASTGFVFLFNFFLRSSLLFTKRPKQHQKHAF